MQDMTSGKPLGLIVKFAIPLLISNCFQQLYSISDILLVGHLIGVKALAAVGAVAPLFFFLVVVSIGFTNGLTVITAQSFGAKNFERMRRSVAIASILSASFTLFFALIIFLFMDQLLHIMNVPEDIYADSKTFLCVINAGVIMIVGFNLLSGLMRALGDSKTPLYFLIFTTLVNIVLNFVFIYYCSMGVAGSALGTVVAMTISFICCIFYMNKKFPLLRPHKDEWRLRANMCKEHLIIAVPMAVQFSIIALSTAVTQAICNKFGAATIAAMTAAMRVEQLGVQPMVSFGIAMSTYVAQNYGANRVARIRRGVLECSLTSLCLSLILAVFVFACGRQIVGIFITDDSNYSASEVISMACTYLNISVLFYFFLGQIFIFRNSCQGMGNSIVPMISSIVELLMRVFAAIYLASIFGFVGLCWASPLAWIGGAAVVCSGYFYTVLKISKNVRHQRLSNQKQKISTKFAKI